MSDNNRSEFPNMTPENKHIYDEFAKEYKYGMEKAKEEVNSMCAAFNERNITQEKIVHKQIAQ